MGGFGVALLLFFAVLIFGQLSPSFELLWEEISEHPETTRYQKGGACLIGAGAVLVFFWSLLPIS
eukprot:NODE_5031_length_738_cov_25.552975_g4217_i0.p2 GENE.NODE_5031_length_738_cov_25.552975_g4217_i0~~NODE_5031_length_738_cov_25.552975_g4217_i0.p2  ORF type:complete len:65 (-),score=18.93 NODE_5031_length_738_cov_25.552975_g4217_i0:203-397(-)